MDKPEEVDELMPGLEKLTPAATDRTAIRALARKAAKRKRRFLYASGALLLTFVISGGYYSFGTANVPEASESYRDGSKIDPCADFEELKLDCSVSFSHSEDVARDGLIAQSAAPGFAAVRPSAIELTYSSGPASSRFPDIIRQDYDAALEELYARGIEVGKVTEVERSDLGASRIVSSSIPTGKSTASGATVDLEISTQTVELPDISGKTREQAELDLSKLGFEVEILEQASLEAAGTVVGQSPAAGNVAKGKTVTLTVAKVEEVKSLTVPAVIGMTEEAAQATVAAAGFTNITVIKVESSKATAPLVSHVAPGEGRNIRSDSNVVIVVSVPEAK